MKLPFLKHLAAGITLIACTISIPALADPVGIASGQRSGTNHPMAEDIVGVCSTPSSPMSNNLSDGSLDNLYKVTSDKNSQYGIAQTDAAIYQRGVDKRMMDRILMVFPFFSVEMHLAVRDDGKINGFNDLAGKRVIEGPEGSGTWVSVQVIKQTTGIQWEGSNLSQLDGLNAVISGKADAEFVVAGAPIKMFENPALKGKIKLIPVSHPKLDAFALYTKTMLPSGLYPMQKSSISTYKVDNMLVTYAFKNQYQKEITDLVTCITRNVPQLQKTGHPKWKDVNPLDIDRIQWPVHPAAAAAIKKESRR